MSRTLRLLMTITFYSSFTLENSWYQLFSQLSEDISLTTDLIKTTIDQIILTSGKPPEIKFYKQEDRSHLFWSLNLISKVKQRLERNKRIDVYGDKRVQITFNYGDWMEPLLDCIEEAKIIESEQEPN